MSDPSTAELLLLWDQDRPRSKQTEFGMSEVGDCRRRAGYRLSGTKPTNVGSSVQAVMGTAIHAAVEQVFRDLQARGDIPAEDLIEHEVTFAGIKGHLDRYEAGPQRLRDTKTTTSRWLHRLEANGVPTRSHLWQVNGYAAALIAEGRPVRRVAIDYLARDTGDEWTWEGPFNPDHVKDALEWVRNVRNTELQFLSRDYEPDSPFCNHCPFRDVCWEGGVAGRDPLSVLYVEDPDAAKWTRQLATARVQIAAARKLEEKAKGALDALRTRDERGPEVVVVDGVEQAIKFTVIETSRLDTDLVKAEYAATGARPPMSKSKTVKVELVAKPKAGAA